MKNIVACLVCTAIIVVLDIIISKKIWKTLLDYSGITLADLQKHFTENDINISSDAGHYGRRNLMRYRQRAIVEYITQYAVDVKSSLKLFNLYKYSTLPIPIATSFVLFERIADNYIYILIAYAVLLLAVISFWIALWDFKRKHPIDEIELEKLEYERKQNKSFQGGNIRIVLTTVFIAVILIVFLVIPMLNTEVRVPTEENSFHRLDISSELYSRGYNSLEVMATYWELDNEKLENLALGEKEGHRFEYYEYSNDETTANVYNSIINDIAPTVEHGDGSVFTIILNDVYYYVEYKGNTVIYAFEPSGNYGEIKQILDCSGYSVWNSVDDMTEEQGTSQADWVAGIVVCFMMLLFTLIVRGSCMAVVFASSNTSRSKFDETDLKMTERLKIMNENTERPFITRVYTFANYAVFLPWIAFCVLGFASYFSVAAQEAFSKYSFWGYAASFIFTVFNYIFSGFLNTKNK